MPLLLDAARSLIASKRVERANNPSELAGARTVADAAVLLDAMTSGAVRADADGTSGLQPGSRVGVLRAEVVRETSPFEDTRDNGAMPDRAATALESLGATCIDVEVADPATASALAKDMLRVVLGGLSHETMPAVGAAGGPTSVRELQRLGLRDLRRHIPRGQRFVALAAARAPVERSASRGHAHRRPGSGRRGAALGRRSRGRDPVPRHPVALTPPSPTGHGVGVRAGVSRAASERRGA
ncbi:hypothetical protein [Humibacillus xanthopallidus]|uniref:hypothetical protein n=1 Tax=Humibacillus xanthopallidus TaxID=412689 RepID=UPI003850AE49